MKRKQLISLGLVLLFPLNLLKSKGKEEISKPKSQCSIYQNGFRMIYWNPIPIDASFYFNKNVVSDGLNSIIIAVYDLITLGKNVILKTGFCIFMSLFEI